MSDHEKYMKRCFDLARLGAGNVSPNPMVGAVLVHENRIIGEGYHKKYGQAHAEVHTLQSVNSEDRRLIEKSTLYVSLEPCCIFGKTPPCTNLILQHKIPKVVISCLDNSPKVAGRGVQILKGAGVNVVTGVLRKEGIWLTRFRQIFIEKKRPYVILKFAQSKDGYMGYHEKQVWISNQFTNRWVHKCRSETDAILIGTNTAQIDDPQLTNRLYFGKSPLRIILDKNLRLPQNLKIFDGSIPTWIVNQKKEEIEKTGNLKFIKLDFDENCLSNLLTKLYDTKITSLIVEGGAFTLQSFLDKNLWDEARIFTSPKVLRRDIKAPDVPHKIFDQHQIGSDELTIYRNSFL